MDYRILPGKAYCELFNCRLDKTCIFAPDCKRDCLYVVELCRVCVLERSCKVRLSFPYVAARQSPEL